MMSYSAFQPHERLENTVRFDLVQLHGSIRSSSPFPSIAGVDTITTGLLAWLTLKSLNWMRTILRVQMPLSHHRQYATALAVALEEPLKSTMRRLMRLTYRPPLRPTVNKSLQIVTSGTDNFGGFSKEKFLRPTRSNLHSQSHVDQQYPLIPMKVKSQTMPLARSALPTPLSHLLPSYSRLDTPDESMTGDLIHLQPGRDLSHASDHCQTHRVTHHQARKHQWRWAEHTFVGRPGVVSNCLCRQREAFTGSENTLDDIHVFETREHQVHLRILVGAGV